jgi:hypothetical protein
MLHVMILVLVTATQPMLALGAGALLAALLVSGIVWIRARAEVIQRAADSM